MKLVVLCNIYNEQDNLPEFLDSLLLQTYLAFSIVFVDDWSTDTSIQVLEKYTLAFTKKGIHVTLHQVDHVWLSSARKYWFDLINDDDYVLILDADQLLDTNYIEYLVATQQEKWAHFITWKRVPYNNGFRSEVLTPIYELFYRRRISENSSEIDRIEWWNMMVSKKEVQRIWWIRSGVLEDTELSERAKMNWYTLYTNPNAVLFHKYDTTIYSLLKREYQYWMRIKDQKIITSTNIIKLWSLLVILFPFYYLLFLLLLLWITKRVNWAVFVAPMLLYVMFISWSCWFLNNVFINTISLD